MLISADYRNGIQNADPFAAVAKDLGKGRRQRTSGGREDVVGRGEAKRKAIGSDERPQFRNRARGFALGWAASRINKPKTGLSLASSVNLSHVKVHTDTRAEESAHEVNAAAYTVGNDVVFGQVDTNQKTTTGRELLGHELDSRDQQESTGSASGA